ncbi:SDR family NAD(P)-dependent oxidoreductase [Amycolatopsis echigonensis]|uniref:3-oxoacyl-ACP reductase FabG n=1 Tax=Amycolatopsis echigonensis TaxID=2576905 RepID=A0A8E2B6M6_9PSEU|nr:3-oxoacyl-ACP reductase family protein [Amycolatopsis echigonensis]MBB2503819.1 3-oxoacyl-ACP reductase FabG [Amycolatopsis echigonensis]
MDSLAGKVCVVTGAGRGIGRAIAERLAAADARVVAADLDTDSAAATAAAVGNGALGIRTDVGSRDSVDSLVDAVLDRFGRIDVLVNNAGWDKAGPFVESDPDDWDRIIRVNLYGVLHTSRAVLPVLAEQGTGSVVNIASDAGRVGSSGEAVYSATKGGIIAFTKTTARELARRGVRVNCVCPGPTDTPLLASFAGEKLRNALVRAIPLGRVGAPADVANAVAFLAGDEAGFITGQTLSVSGGLTMA